MLCTTVSADSGSSFTHMQTPGGKETTVLSRELYTAEEYITASSLGLEESLAGITDVCFDAAGKIYLLCGSSSRLIVLNDDYSYDMQLPLTDESGAQVDFTGARGIYVDKSNRIYIADTNNARVIIANGNGRIEEIWYLPESDLIPADFVFQPTSIVKDNQNNTYIISQGCYYGALTYSADGEFKGFYGANTVEATALDTLEFLWDKLTGSDAKREASVKKLPYSFVDFSLDADGYMVVCTGTTESSSNGEGQIRKISPGGSDILYGSDKGGDTVLSSTINFLEEKVVKKALKTYPQNIISVDVDPSGFIYALDQTFGLVYIYDDSCNMLGAFGGGFGTGNKIGTFAQAETVSVKDDTVLVADSANGSVTVFKETEYGKTLKAAHSLYLQGNYKEAEPYWNRVLELDGGNLMAYKGLAMIRYYNGEYEEALSLAEKGLDYSVYDLAYQEIFKQFIEDNFVIIAIAAVLLAGILVYLLIKFKKRKRAPAKNPKLATLKGVLFHPFRSFNDLKYKNLGSVRAAIILLALFFASSVLNDTVSGFLFSSYSPQSYNVFFTLAKTVGLVVLWTVANLLVTTLFGGKGNLKEIFIASSYSLIPIIIYNFIYLIFSYILPLSGMSFMSGIYTFILIYTFFILSVAMMTVHEYGFSKFVGTGLLSIFGMLLVVFVLFMIIIQIQQFGIFISSIFMEVIYR